MSLFGPVEHRNIGARTWYTFIYVVLTLGSVTMVYPFLLMLGSSVTTEIDFEDWRVIPAYLTDDTALFRKWMDDRYGDAFSIAKRVHRLNISRFRDLDTLPDFDVGDTHVQRRLTDWRDCAATLSDEYFVAFHRDLRRVRPTHRKFERWLSARYQGDIRKFNEEFFTAYVRFNEITPVEYYYSHKTRPDRSPLRQLYLEFRKSLPQEDLMPVLASYGFQDYLERYVGTLKDMNELFGTQYNAVAEILLPTERPREPGAWRDTWDTYVQKRFPLAFVRVEGDFDAAYREFLSQVHGDYDSRVRSYNAEHGTTFPLLAETHFPPVMPENDFEFADWVAFVDRRVPPEAKKLVTPEGLWRDWLKQKYKDLDSLNRAHGTAWRTWDEVLPPAAEVDLAYFYNNRSLIRKEFFLRNYRYVLDYMVFHGRAAWNTLVLVSLTVLGHLTVQPLAAYGLSRFRLRYSHQILLILLATMAFPPTVAMIPNFLLIRELGLLNTYWALILPGLASGMGIFLLKGYFDSLPRELYEAAMMDGAGELRMFTQITLPLSKPILAVLALGSFSAAYGGFMWAFLICQDPKMWTMMVFLWQLGRETYPSVWMASLVIAALPTLLVFIFCQKIILRGIIVPTEK